VTTATDVHAQDALADAIAATRATFEAKEWAK
jgi:hypothetical protein